MAGNDEAEYRLRLAEGFLKVGIKAKRLKAGRDHAYLLKILNG